MTEAGNIARLRGTLEDIDHFETWGLARYYDKIEPGQVALATWAVLDIMHGIDNVHIENFFKTPQYFINNVLQGKFMGAWNTASRLLINSTIGLGGFVDVASKMGIEKRPETFGDTLGVWGWKKSSYVQIPFKAVSYTHLRAHET